MAQRLQAYLHKNRVGTFTFRWRPPKGERDRFDRVVYEFSLGTKDRALAWPKAARAAIMAHALLALARTMPKPKNKEEIYSFELIRSFTLPDGTTETIDYDPEKPGDAKEAERVVAEIRARQSQLVASLPAAVTQPSTPAGATPTISAVFRAYCEEKTSTRAWKHPVTSEKYDYGPMVALLIELVGDKPMNELVVENLRGFRKRVLAEAGTTTNKNKKLQRLRAFIEWASAHEYTTAPTAPLSAVRAQGKAKHYEPFTADELVQLFHSNAYRTHEFKEANQFWIPLLGLYTGARINELAQLHIDDITAQDGVDIIRIDDDDYKRTKTDASIRSVPIHSALIAAGLLDYVKALREEGWSRLFPELRWSDKSGYGKDPSSDFTAYRRACGVSPDRDRVKVFHSFRTTANSALRRADVPQERRERLVGHESEDTNNRAYRPADRGEMFAMVTLRDDMEKLSFNLTHPRYEFRASHREQRLRAARRRISRGGAEEQDRTALARLPAR